MSEEKYVDCSVCINCYYCMEVVNKLVTELQRLGVCDFDLKFKVCSRYAYNENHKRDEEQRNNNLVTFNKNP